MREQNQTIQNMQMVINQDSDKLLRLEEENLRLSTLLSEKTERVLEIEYDASKGKEKKDDDPDPGTGAGSSSAGISGGDSTGLGGPDNQRKHRDSDSDPKRSDKQSGKSQSQEFGNKLDNRNVIPLEFKKVQTTIFIDDKGVVHGHPY